MKKIIHIGLSAWLIFMPISWATASCVARIQAEESSCCQGEEDTSEDKGCCSTQKKSGIQKGACGCRMDEDTDSSPFSPLIQSSDRTPIKKISFAILPMTSFVSDGSFSPESRVPFKSKTAFHKWNVSIFLQHASCLL